MNQRLLVMISVLVIIISVVGFYYSKKVKAAEGKNNMKMVLTSSDFADNKEIPRNLTCDGTNELPKLQWKDAPKNTKSFALICEDPDAPGGTFVHWIVYNISATMSGLTIDDVSKVNQGKNSFGNTAWGGPCPPPTDNAHHYIFTLYALDLEKLSISAGATRDEVIAAAEGHVIQTAVLTGLYKRAAK